MHLIAGALGLLGVVYCGMGPWQLEALGVEARETVLIPYLILEGVLCTLLEPTFIPLMLDVAEKQATGGKVDAHLTNFVTSLGQTCFNMGQLSSIVGVFAVNSVGFRGALVAWACPFLLVSVWMGVRLLRQGRGRRPAKAERIAWLKGVAQQYAPLPTASDMT